ncbi:hypothetical protein AB1K83_09820 [Sporosarcina sp. 179-K 3D1 HS]|uniref:hypothetical protein n=1 Tax=Sporosarcina sp. 179-K 3D1 HS TaxID=3232169 RepID=UPI0039A21691
MTDKLVNLTNMFPEGTDKARKVTDKSSKVTDSSRPFFREVLDTPFFYSIMKRSKGALRVWRG